LRIETFDFLNIISFHSTARSAYSCYHRWSLIVSR
jgi:hypothetical protein